nr:PREDICTED: uncharacterized protein LOC108225058 [Daucus carota subsp. sativus]
MSGKERDFEIEHAGKRRKMEDTGSVVCRDIDHGKCKLVEDSYVENDEDSVCGSELKGDGELVHRDGDSCVSGNVCKDIIPCGSKSDGSICGDGDHRVTFIDAARDSTVEVKSVSEGLGNGGQVDGDDVSRERNSSSADQSSCIVSEQTHLDSPTNDSADQISERKKRETITKDENNAQAKFVETNKDGREEKPHLCKGIDVRKKLLVLDINGLLADVVSASSVSDDYKADIVIGMKAVFKRPHCDDFLQFCFERFNVGIWSSRTKKNIDPILELLLGGHRSKLVFCWDQSHCTPTGFNTIDNQRKPLVLKELKKFWGKDYPSLPWNIGDYDESNTLLLDDSPYKGLRNPPNTAIFPNTYEYKNLNDDSLGPKGDLRAYLEGLSLAPNVQEYVEHNSYGQQPISRSNPLWPFYAKVMGIDYTKHKEPSCQNASKGINIRLEEEAYRGTRGDNARTQYSERNTRSTAKDSVQLSSKTNQLWNCRAGRTKEARYPRIQHTQFGMNRGSFRKTKLLILDVNGLLADFVSYEPHGFKAHSMLGDKAVFKRPYCDDFLHFCFEKFHIGFWMTTSRRNAESNLDLLLGQELKQNVLFSWDISHCWGTNFCTLERTQPRDRHIYFKELHKVWETDEPNLLRLKYEFNQSNTLLVDNFPHSALLNPPHTAIFPPRYRFKDESTDNTLG